MNRNHEKLLVATLAGLIIAGAAAFAIQPALASASAPVGGPAYITSTQPAAMTLWPTTYSFEVATAETGSAVWVERCTEHAAAGWCLVQQGDIQGWMPASSLALAFDFI
jgi:hypothetical protein